MKKVLIFCLALLLLGAGLCSCGTKAMKLTPVGDTFVNEKNGVTFLEAPYENYRVNEIYPDSVIAIVKAATGNVSLYEIPGMDKTQFLADENGTVYYAEGVYLPTLAEMKLEKISVCRNADRPQVLESVSEETEMKALVEKITTATGEERKFYDDRVTANFLLVFTSDTGLLYTLEYWRLSETDGVVFDRTAGLCYAVGSLVEDTFSD